MKSFVPLTAALLLIVSSANAFVSHGKVTTRSSYPLPRLNALDDLTSKLVGGAMASSASGAVDISAVDPTILMGGGAILAVIAIGVAVVGSKSGENTYKETAAAATPAMAEPEPEPIDVSIPYDAAALLAYQQQVNPKGDILDKEFQTFKHMYYEMSVAEVILKQNQRKLQEIKDKMKAMYPSPADAVNGATKETLEV
jgi:hypothetical protein